MSGEPGRREVAYRLFATEFDDSEFSYSESDEERAPNYVVTPTGARVNRLFAVGVLTEVEDVNPEMVRGRVVDPTGAFVTYAGQYQPDALTYLERAEPPTFLALSGKARTFEPDDGDRIYTSVRPEAVNEVDAETRDRWIVSTAERTLERIGVMAAAIESGLVGDELRGALEAEGVDERLADGVALALEYYGTTPAYLSALRKTALDAVRVVAGEIDEVAGLDVAPGEGGSAETDASALATLGLSSEPRAETTAATAATATAAAGDVDDSADSAEVPIETESADTESSLEPIEDVESEATRSATDAETAGAETADAETADETDIDDTDSEFDTEPGIGAESGPKPEPELDVSSETEPETEPTVEATADGIDEEPDEFDPGEFELDEETRQEVEEEYGTEFSTAGEVEEPDAEMPASSDHDTPAAEAEPELPEETEPGLTEELEPEASEGSEPDVEADVEPDVEADVEPDVEAETTSEPETEASDESEVDLETAVMHAMEDLDEGDGAAEEELVASVADARGVSSEAVENAIQDALMSGRCYEPTDGRFKPI